MAYKGKTTTSQQAAYGFQKPLTPEQRAKAASEGVPTNENDIPDPNTNRTGYFNGTGFLPQLGNYGVDLLTGGPARRGQRTCDRKLTPTPGAETTRRSSVLRR